MSIFDLPGASGSTTRGTKPAVSRFDLSMMCQDELLTLRSEIDNLLPVTSLKDLNMEQELVMQLLTVQRLQRDVLGDDSVPANQRAQTANAVAATLATLAKLQVEVHNSERLKKIEQILIETLQTLPMEAQEAFVSAYERALG